MEEVQAGRLDVLQMGWKENVYSLFFCTVDIAFEVGQELQKQFLLTIPLPLERGLVEQLLLLADQLLWLVTCLESFTIAVIRTTWHLPVDAIFHVFSAADSALCAGPCCHVCVCLQLVHAPNKHPSMSLRPSWDGPQRPLQSLGLQ